jgi:hypothetical protein
LVLISWSAVASSAGIGVAPAAESASRAVVYPDAAMFRHRLQQPDRLITPTAGTDPDNADDLRVKNRKIRVINRSSIRKNIFSDTHILYCFTGPNKSN